MLARQRSFNALLSFLDRFDLESLRPEVFRYELTELKVIVDDPQAVFGGRHVRLRSSGTGPYALGSVVVTLLFCAQNVRTLDWNIRKET